jgi:hypothetical protein
MSEKNELLPCPFCGGPVELERAADTRSDIYGVRKWWGVKCRNTINLGGTCAVEAIPSASPEAAISRWNRRACPPASVRGVEMGDEEILHLWDTHVGYETQAPSSRKMPLGREDKLVFARAILSAASAPNEELPTPSQLRAMARPAPDCLPGRHCERHKRDLGACIAGTCSRPKPADTAGVAAAPAPQTEPEPQLVGYEECRCILTQYCDGTCRPVFALPAVLERAKTLYANSPGAYRGTQPLPWPQAPMPTKLEFIARAKVDVGRAALGVDSVDGRNHG